MKLDTKLQSEQAGFSIIELLVAIAIVSILLSSAIYSYLLYVNNAKDQMVYSDGIEIHKFLDTDKLAITLGGSGALSQGLTSDSTCRDLIDQAVVNLVIQNKLNPFDQSFMVVTDIADSANLRRGSVYIACSQPDAKINSPTFHLQTCICTESDCELTPINPGDSSPLSPDICYRLPS